MNLVTVYDSSDDSLAYPVQVDELSAYISAEGRAFAFGRKRRWAITHLITRMRDTLLDAEATRKALRNTVSELQLQRSRIGLPSTLAPIDAARYLSPEERDELFEPMQRDYIRQLRTLVGAADTQRQELLAMLDRIVGAASVILNRPDLDHHTRAEFARLLSELPRPDQLPTVDHPAALEHRAGPTYSQVALPAAGTHYPPAAAEPAPWPPATPTYPEPQ